MRKYILLLWSLLLVSLLCVGCSQDGNGAQAKDFSFVYQQTEIVPHAEAGPIIEKLGEPESYHEYDSCAFQGKDKRYQYKSVIICTYPKDGADFIYTIQLKDDLVETQEGVYIGISMEKVREIYGEPTEDTGTCYIYRRGKTELNIMYASGLVSDIVYSITND